jgi:glucose-1-phosphate thymidylyltransferase
MKGVILAGGMGTRLHPATKITNKHLLPVYDKPMIYYPLTSLIDAGITDIMIITGPEFAGDFMRLLGSGEDLGVDLTYKIQDKASGIAGALKLARDFILPDKYFVVILGDNIFTHGLNKEIEAFSARSLLRGVLIGGVVLKEVSNPEEYGVATVNDAAEVVRIVEKPKHPESNLCVTGVYFYPSSVFDMCEELTPSERNELEITDINNRFVELDRLIAFKYEYGWYDAGTHDGILRTSNAIKKLKK